MIQIKNVLVPTDCSELSKEALLYAVDFVKKFSASLILLRVMPIQPMSVIGDYGHLTPQLIQAMIEETEARAKEELEKFWDSIVELDIEAELVHLCGDPFAEIVRYAKNNSVDLIIMGTHGHTGIKHVLMGSVAEKVVRYSPLPVLTIKRSGYGFDINN